jgi:cytochrome c553
MSLRGSALFRTITLALLVVAIAFWVFSVSLSARAQPSVLETLLARRIRRLAVPRSVRHQQNPVPLTPDLLVEVRRHFADHCAACHGNDGSGNTEIGRHLYPRVPDMRLAATQSLNDGELYYIIHNGIRFTGMPAWGPDTNHDHDSWELVHFIRHLPRLTSQEIEDMTRFNPKSPAEIEEEKEEEEFLNGKPSK